MPGQVIEDDNFPNAGRDEEIKARQEAEKAAAREEHNRRTGGGGTVADRQNKDD